MKRYYAILLVFVTNLFSTLAYDRHGRDYSANGGGGSSAMLLIIGVIILFLFLWFNSGKKDKK